MATAKKVLKIEKSYVKAAPYGPYNIFNSHNGQPWCAYFQHYCLIRASKELGDWFNTCSNYAYVPAIYAWAKANGTFTRNGKPGDLVLFDWNSNKSPDHIGMLIKKQGGVYVTVEGNTSNVSQGNGGCVQIRYREGKWILGFVRPPYKKAKKKVTAEKTYSGTLPTGTLKVGSSGSSVKKWQKFMIWMGEDLKADGKFGAMTRRATIDVQKQLHVTADGIVGPATLLAAKKYHA